MLSSYNPVSGVMLSNVKGSLTLTLGVKTCTLVDYSNFLAEPDNQLVDWVLLGEIEGVVTFMDEENQIHTETIQDSQAEEKEATTQ